MEMSETFQKYKKKNLAYEIYSKNGHNNILRVGFFELISTFLGHCDLRLNIALRPNKFY